MAKTTRKAGDPKSSRAFGQTGGSFQALFTAHPSVKDAVVELLDLCRAEGVSSDRVPGEIVVALRAIGRQHKESNGRELCYQLAGDPGEVMRMIEDLAPTAKARNGEQQQ